MRRKIIPHGPSSLTVSLPSRWVKQHNLKKGEEVDVFEEDNRLLIKPASTDITPKKADISLIDIDPEICKDMILSLHKKGYDEINIRFNNPNTIKELHSFLNSMQLGFEILKQDTDSAFIRNISNPESEQFDNLFRRVFRITLEYSNKVNAIISNKEGITHSCLLHETSINRISNYCKRIIVKERHQNACFLYSILKELNELAHGLTLILKEIEDAMPEEFLLKYQEVNELMIQIYNLYYKFSLTNYSIVKKNSDKVEKQIKDLKADNLNNQSYWDHLESITNSAKTILEIIPCIYF